MSDLAMWKTRAPDVRPGMWAIVPAKLAEGEISYQVGHYAPGGAFVPLSGFESVGDAIEMYRYIVGVEQT